MAKRYAQRNISLLLLALFVMCTLLLWVSTMGISMAELVTFSFYAVLLGFILTITILAAFLHPRIANAKAELRKIFSLSVFDTFDQMFVGPLLFVAMFSIYLIGGASFRLPDTKDIAIQLIWVVPPETFIFIVFLPILLPSVWRIPPWVLSAAVFAGMHIPHYSQMTTDPPALAFLVGIAFLMGCVWYLMYRAGEKYKGMGIVSVMAFHFTWNVVALSVGASMSTALVWFARMMGIA